MCVYAIGERENFFYFISGHFTVFFVFSFFSTCALYIHIVNGYYYLLDVRKKIYMMSVYVFCISQKKKK